MTLTLPSVHPLLVTATERVVPRSMYTESLERAGAKLAHGDRGVSMAPTRALAIFSRTPLTGRLLVAGLLLSLLTSDIIMKASANQGSSRADEPASQQMFSSGDLLSAGSLMAPGSASQMLLNNKRTRKLSSFMPMRGRRADEELDLALRELDEPELANLGQSAPRPFWPQFATSFMARRSAAEDAESAPVYEDTLIVPGPTRRAFHPMRGKKWSLDERLGQFS